MNWKSYFSSSIGRKIVMSLTGLFLISFLIVHATVNGMIFFNDGGEMFNYYAHFLSHNYLIRVAEIGLFLGLIVHIVQGLLLTMENNKKRPVKYAVNPGSTTSTWYSRSMGLLGSILLIFLVVHLAHFWVGTKMALYGGGEEHNLYLEMQIVFQELWVVVVYLLGVVALFWHLWHGFKSAFQTLGIHSLKYNTLIQRAGQIYCVLICVAFALMPLAFYLGWIQ